MSDWDESFDLIVVGSGGGGMVGALAAAEQGLSVLLLESTEKFGGSTGMSGGILWVPNHPLQRSAGVTDSHEAGASYLAALTHDDPTPLGDERRRAFLDAGPELASFLMRQGLPMRRCDGWSDYHDELPGGCARGRSIRTELFDTRELGDWASRLRVGSFPLPIQWPESQQLALIKRTPRGFLTGAKVTARAAWARFRGAKLVSMGAALQGRLLKLLIAAKGVDLRSEAAMTELVTDGGRVTGVVVEIDGRSRRIEARRGVLIGSGGFAHNQPMREQHMPQPTNESWSHTNPGDLGVPIVAAMKAGASTYFDGNAIWLVTSRTPEGPLVFHLHDLAKPHCIMVDSKGCRFSDESGSYMKNGQNMYKAGAVPAWAILDSRHRQNYPWGKALPGKPPQHYLDTGYMKLGETLEELAVACGIDPEGLRQTCKRFNEFARTGVDLDFHRGDNAYDKVFGDPTHRPNPCLGAIERGPFYAVQVVPGDVGTVGGLVVDGNAQVVGNDGQPVPGLYAAGNCTAPTFGRTYPGAGASIAATAVFGYIAARHAANA